MIRDPVYQQIIAGLSGHLDPEVFEQCMADLLRDAFPGLVPVPGGSDAGMDAAIADGKGEPFPLVSTTSGKVAQNLAKSLDSFAKRFATRKVALATSQALTPQRRLKLFELARERGFALLQVIERRGVADRLYRNSHWRKALLGIAGAPSALSVVPLTRRPLIDLQPIGREADIAWVEARSRDCVLVGEPGSGKTFLLYFLMRRGWPGLFVIGTDTEAIADALRDQKPRVVVLDDAHANLGQLVEVVRLRQEISAEFSILATTWAGGLDQVADVLGVGGAQVRKLELLTRKEVLEVIEKVGVREDADVLRHLVDQSANKPGLAVTIASLWLQGSWQEVADGTVLRRTLLGFFEDFVGPKSMRVLGAFALGGDRGLALEVVADELRLDLAEVHQIAAGLAAGGVLSEVDGEALAVWPRVLRSALIREVFFPDAGPKLPFESLLARAPSAASAVEALVHAKGFRAAIPDEFLRPLVVQSGSDRAWTWMAEISQEQSRWVLEHYPRNSVRVWRTALELAPDSAIPVLLGQAEEPPSAYPPRPMDLLADWVRDIPRIPKEEQVEEIAQRRRTLAGAARRYLDGGGERSVGLQAIFLALSPGLEARARDPVTDNQLTEQFGLLSVETLRRLLPSLWDEVRDAITKIDTASWGHLKAALWEWLYPEYASRGSELPKEYDTVMHGFAAKVLNDLAPLAAESLGLASGLVDLGRRMGTNLRLEVDPTFELLFMEQEVEQDVERWKIHAEDLRARVQDLAAEWAREEPSVVVARILAYEREAQRIAHDYPRRTPYLCHILALAAAAPESWLDALIAGEAAGDLVQPFLARIARARRDGWDRYLEAGLASDRYAWVTTGVALSLPVLPATLLEATLASATQFPQLVETLCLRREVPLNTLEALLLHTEEDVAVVAAVGEWHAGGAAKVRTEISAALRSAILRAQPGDRTGSQYWLGVILAGDPDLAFDWLSARLNDRAETLGVPRDGPLAQAISALDRGRRIEFLERHPQGPFPPDFLRLLVGRDSEIYRHLMKLDLAASQHLEPLGGNPPDDVWLENATQALQAGYSPSEVATATVTPSSVWAIWQGNLLSYWQEYDRAFAQFEGHPRADIREVGRAGRTIAKEQIERATERQRAVEVHGRQHR